MLAQILLKDSQLTFNDGKAHLVKSILIDADWAKIVEKEGKYTVSLTGENMQINGQEIPVGTW